MTTTTERGTYVERDGRPAVGFERVYPHSVERVWRAITEPEELVHWFPSRVAYDAAVGSTITFAEDPYTEPTEGKVLVWEPPHRFAFEWGEDEIHLTLDETSGGCSSSWSTSSTPATPQPATRPGGTSASASSTSSSRAVPAAGRTATTYRTSGRCTTSTSAQGCRPARTSRWSGPRGPARH